ncbi:hypothetical protein [Polaribacter sp.]|jgi:hypothetical protein|uniref:hypothetical protein n=1 Tax=Polaribacter sp. TaxID=1920175 RepID=UPI0040477171
MKNVASFKQLSKWKLLWFLTGVQIAGEKKWNTIIRVDFHRKGIIGFENNRLDSISFGIGFSFF